MRGVPLIIAPLYRKAEATKMVVLRGLLLPLLALVSIALTALYVVDIVRTNSRSSGCEMTYSWPIYTRLDGFKDLASHRKYSLHSVHMQTARDKLTGVPVLFVPGHMGSYKQARSLSRHLWDIDANKYDVFAVDFQEELTGLSGQFVEDQARFVNDAVRVILKQYQKQIRKSKGSDKRRKAPESVVIVAHSMGGVVVRTAQLLPNHKRNTIQHVISLGTPFSRSLFPYDADLQNVYSRMHKDVTPAASTAYLSISGGHKDITIHASMSLTDKIAPATHGVAVLSSKVPAIGLTVDHLCLVWCHQLLKRVASSIDAVVDGKMRDLIKDEETRLQIARSHLLGATANAGDDELDALIELHGQSLVDGYHSVDEFASYGTLIPQAVLRLFHLRSLSLGWMMFLIVLHIFHLQLTHWQRRFDLNAEPSSIGPVPVVAGQESYPSLSSLLHPAVHAPGFVKLALAFIDQKLSTADKTKRSSIIGGLVGVAVVLVAVVTELGRRYSIVKSVSVEVVELATLYLVAIGMLYTLVLVLSALRVIVQPLVRVAVAIARRTRTKRWFVISMIYLTVQLLGHVRDFELLSLGSSPRHLALLVLASVLVFVLHVLELGVKLEGLTADQQRYRATLFALFGLSSLTWIGEIVFFFDVVRFPPTLLSNDLLGHAASVIVVLALFRYFITVTESEMVPLPPTAFFDSADGGDEENDSGVEITAENCPRCVIEDGGPGAVFIEYQNSSTKKFRTSQNELVVVGPTFRVVACDCVLRFKQPREYCSFCTRSCRLCGGGSGNYAQAQKYREFLEKSKTEVALHSLVAFVMELGVLVLIVLQKEHNIFYAMPTIVLVLVLYHGFLRHPIEAQRLKKELRKREKKLAGNNAKKKQKKKTSSAARRKAMQKTASTASTSTSSTTASSQKKPTPTTKSNSFNTSVIFEDYTE